MAKTAIFGYLANFGGELQMAKKEQKTYWIVDPMYDLRFFLLGKIPNIRNEIFEKWPFLDILQKR